MIDASTELYGVWGHPVRHSLSPKLHNRAFAAAGINAVYVAFDVHPAQLPAAVTGARALGLTGWNLTLPHKQAILKHLDLIDPLAGRIGAVNTVRLREGRLEGFNTDAAGFLQPLRKRTGFDPKRCHAVLLGAGGAARAVAFALADAGAACLTILNRTPTRAAALAADLSAHLKHLRVITGELEEPIGGSVLSGADLVVQCTSRGLAGEAPVAVRWEDLKPSAVVADLVYGRDPGAFLAAAAEAGLTTHAGSWMLVGQAAEAFRLWTGTAFDLDVAHGWLLE